MVLLAGLSAFSVTLLTGSILMEPTYSQFTSKAAMVGKFEAKKQFCTKDDDKDHDDADKGLQVAAGSSDADKRKPHPPKACEREGDDDKKALPDQEQSGEPSTQPATPPEEQPQPQLPAEETPSGTNPTPAAPADGGSQAPDAAPPGDSMNAPTPQDAPPTPTPPDSQP
jgi:hypothetical protein